MAERTPDVELLFGVEGGGSVDGASGKLIKEQIESIVSSINNKPIGIKVKINDASLKEIKQEIQKISDIAKFAVRVSKSTTTTVEGGTKSSSARSSNSTSQVKEIQATTAALKQLLSLRKIASAGMDSTYRIDAYKDSYNSFKKIGKEVDILSEKVANGKITIDEYNKEFSILNNNAASTRIEFEKLSKSNKGSILKGTEKYFAAFENINRTKIQIASVKDNTVKDGISSGLGIAKQEKALAALEEQLKRGTLGYSKFNTEIKKVKSSLAQIESGAKSRGNYGKITNNTRLFAGEGATTEEIQATTSALKQLVSLKKVADTGVASTSGISTYEASYATFTKLSQDIESLSQRLSTGKMTVSEYSNEISKLSYNAAVAKTEFDKLSKSSGDGSGVIQRDIKKVATLMSSIQNMQNKYTKAAGMGSKSKESYTQLGNLYDQLSVLQTQRLNGQISANDFAASYSRIALEAKKAEESIKSVGEATMSVGSKVKNMFAKFSAWFSISQITMYAVRSAKQMVSNVIDIDSAMTELKKVTDETDNTYAKFLDGASTRAKNLGATITDVVSSTADFARLGYDINTASEYADAANVYKNVGDGIQDISEASESIISTVKAFSEYENNPMSIVDKFNEVGNNFAISSQGIGEALKRSASSLATAGNTLDESIGLITAANSVIQDPDSVGTALKTISMYLRAAKTDAEAAGEETDGMASSVSELRSEILRLTDSRVDIMLDPTTFKSTYQILKELADVWNDLSDVDTANILELIGGKRNGNVITSLIKNFNVAESAANTSANDSEGSALKENEKQLESIQGKLNRLETSFQDLSNTVIDSGFLKTLVDSGTMILDILDGGIKSLEQINGIIPAIIAGISGIKTITQNVGEHCKHATLYSVA